MKPEMFGPSISGIGTSFSGLGSSDFGTVGKAGKAFFASFLSASTGWEATLTYQVRKK